MRLIPQDMTAVLVLSPDAPGIRREMSEIAGEGFALALSPEQVQALEVDYRRARVDASIDHEVVQ